MHGSEPLQCYFRTTGKNWVFKIWSHECNGRLANCLVLCEKPLIHKSWIQIVVAQQTEITLCLNLIPRMWCTHMEGSILAPMLALFEVLEKDNFGGKARERARMRQDCQILREDVRLGSRIYASSRRFLFLSARRDFSRKSFGTSYTQGFREILGVSTGAMGA